MVLLVVTTTDLLAQDFIENFSDSSFIDLTLTTANVSTEDQAVYLTWSNTQTHRLPNSNSSGTPVGSQTDSTLSVAFADVDGDGDVDLVASNNGETNKLYLND
ncbi:hypothetical protein N9Y40_06930, partial [Porticoccaceae bacterium]|nr:hypothetical protein [Porticoccaceae bacterium]